MFKDIANFESKKERDDFFIAILVVLFFIGLIIWLSPKLLGNDSSLSKNSTKNNITPTAIITDMDTDGDGIMDTDDKCIMTAGVAPSGCPSDMDNDGIFDTEDKCPKLAGDINNGGCPLDSDIDGDGIQDAKDRCPELAGITANNGCPEIKIEVEEKQLLEKAVQSVEFETGSAKLKRVSRAILFRIAKLMNKYPNYKLDLVGHTDNVGEKDANMELSHNRAKSCFDYFVDNGVDANRISYKGHGSSLPIDTNETDAGKENNRRVEFNLHY